MHLQQLCVSLACAQVMAYPSKGSGMFVCESLIFRSDSNGEDLEGYAGAGLYDSITLDATETRRVDYGADKYASSDAEPDAPKLIYAGQLRADAK